MTVLKGTREKLGGNKNGYRYTHEGREFRAIPNGSKWDCYNGSKLLGTYKTVAEIRSLIVSGEIGGDDGDPEDQCQSTKDRQIWDCADPSALLIARLGPLRGSYSELEIETLDCYGWLDESGNPDVVLARSNIERHSASTKKKHIGAAPGDS